MGNGVHPDGKVFYIPLFSKYTPKICSKKMLFISLPEAVFLSRCISSAGPGKRCCTQSVKVSEKRTIIDYSQEIR
jgi:hypothetical protein